MLVPDELRLLNYLADEYYTGEGAIVDAGCFLGGSTVALADGLRRNLLRRQRTEEKLIHSYDRFEIEAYNRLVDTEDRREGIRAFNEKRKPDFKGR